MNRTRLLTLFVSLVLFLAACVPTPTATPGAPPPGGGTLTVAFLDIGQGDSILIHSPNGSTMLIDGGNSDRDASEVILPKLREWGAQRLDVMVATHPDADHIGGLPEVLENFPVANVALTGQVHTTKIYERFLTDIRDLKVNAIQVRTGTPIPFDPAVTVEVLAPDEKFVQDEGDTNDASIVIKLTYGSISFMFTGDAEEPEEQAILASGTNVRSTVLKVGHHGSRSSTSEPFLTAVDPQIGIISAGQGNRYGHPHQEILDRLNAAGVTIYRTDQSGTITVTTDGSTLNVQTDR
ncbi:MAG TPA: ComEC/Rec2 family competence protein [Anaerolineae bacterium]